MYRVFDAHAHIFPNKIAKKATENIGKFYDLSMDLDGTVDTLLRLGDTYRVERFLVQSVATVPEQVQSINDFISSQVTLYPQRLTGFASLHPDMVGMDEEIDRIIALGLKGIKLHPDFQLFHADDDKAMKLYEKIEGRLPLLIHAGDHRYDYSGPKRIANILTAFPKLDVIAAHFGGWSQWEEAEKYLAGKRVWVDTSSTMYEVEPAQVRHMIQAFGADRVLFGTDFPMWKVNDELRYMSQLKLEENTLQNILYYNAARFLGIE